jgi:hypothetical protein
MNFNISNSLNILYKAKYIKYKNKYIQLKNMVGGNKIRRYILFGVFNHDEIGKYLDDTYAELAKLIPEDSKDPQWKHSIKYAHATFVYGPEINEEVTMEYPDISLNDLYPEFEEKYKDVEFDDLIYKGVSFFIRKNRIVVKASFESKKLNEVRNHLYNCSEAMKENYKSWKTSIEKEDDEISKMDKYKAIHKKDETFADEPKGWIHGTLAVLGPAASVEKILELKSKAEELLSTKLVIGKSYSMNSIRLKTPISGNIFRLW